MVYATDDFVHANIFPDYTNLHRQTFYSYILSNLLSLVPNLQTIITVTIFNPQVCKTEYM